MKTKQNLKGRQPKFLNTGSYACSICNPTQFDSFAFQHPSRRIRGDILHQENIRANTGQEGGDLLPLEYAYSSNIWRIMEAVLEHHKTSPAFFPYTHNFVLQCKRDVVYIAMLLLSF